MDLGIDVEKLKRHSIIRMGQISFLDSMLPFERSLEYLW